MVSKRIKNQLDKDDPNAVQPDDELVIWKSGHAPTGHISTKISIYKVKAGDTMFSIARKFKTSAATIRHLNHMSAASAKLRLGQNLRVPYVKIKVADVRYKGANHVKKAKKSAARKVIKHKV